MVWVLWILPSYPLFASFVSLILSGLMRSHGRTFTLVAGISGSAAFLRVMLKYPPWQEGAKASGSLHDFDRISLLSITVTSRRY